MAKKTCRRRFIGRLHDGTKVFQADGNCQRRVDPEFVEGCHHRVDHCKDIPKGQIWVERMLSREDEVADAMHEIPEYLLMRYAGMSYDEAHRHALGVEQIFRRWPRR